MSKKFKISFLIFSISISILIIESLILEILKSHKISEYPKFNVGEMVYLRLDTNEIGIVMDLSSDYSSFKIKKKYSSGKGNGEYFYATEWVKYFEIESLKQ